jgi:phage FluMu gp28-like protein
MAATALKPLASTLRVLEWGDLPASVREVPDNFDPLAEGVLMKHQVEWVQIHAAIKACPKGRRTGMTFATALARTVTAASRKSAGGSNVFYIGDTKEKGLEFIGYCAKFARSIARAQLQGVSSIEEFLFEDQDETGRTKHITSYRIRFASGFQITALSSRPANIRGLQGIVVIDEAAFHADVQGVLDAATALLIWGGSIEVISSHNGKKNPFNQFCNDIEAGRYGDEAVVYTATFDDAVANGLYERAQMMQGKPATAADKAKWYARIRNAYGPRRAAMLEELDAIPRDGGGVAIPGVWIENAMREERPVLRVVLDEDFAKLPPKERERWAEDWIKQHLAPELAKLNDQLTHVGGYDFARHRDFSVLVPIAIYPGLVRRVPFTIEMHKVPTRQQEQISWALWRGLPKFCGAAIDATGTGETMAEYTGDEFGELIHQIKLSRGWYGTWMPKMAQGFEDGVIDIPRDNQLHDDLRAIEDVQGIMMVPDVRTADIKDPDLFRHGDFAIALCLAYYASLNLSGRIDFHRVQATRETERLVKRGAGWRNNEGIW